LRFVRFIQYFHTELSSGTCQQKTKLIFFRNLSRLEKWSSLSILFILFIIVSIFVRLSTLGDDDKRLILADATESEWKYFDVMGLPTAIGIMSSGMGSAKNRTISLFLNLI
jgi:hypothetical protein